MSSFEDFVTQTNQATSPDEVFALFQKALTNLGFDHIVYSLVTDHPSLNKHAQHGVEGTYPDEWMQRYFDQDYIKFDPVCQLALKSPAPFTWSWMIDNHDLAPVQQQIMDEAGDFKLLEGITIPIYGPNGEVAGFGFATNHRDVNTDKSSLHLLRAYASQFHLAYSEYQALPDQLATIKLTPREKEILLWAAEGKSDPVIADILNISYATVRFHMANIFEKLGANERTLAVVKALRLGLIIPSFINPDYQVRPLKSST